MLIPKIRLIRKLSPLKLDRIQLQLYRHRVICALWRMHWLCISCISFQYYHKMLLFSAFVHMSLTNWIKCTEKIKQTKEVYISSLCLRTSAWAVVNEAVKLYSIECEALHTQYTHTQMEPEYEDVKNEMHCKHQTAETSIISNKWIASFFLLLLLFWFFRLKIKSRDF